MLKFTWFSEPRLVLNRANYLLHVFFILAVYIIHFAVTSNKNSFIFSLAFYVFILQSTLSSNFWCLLAQIKCLSGFFQYCFKHSGQSTFVHLIISFARIQPTTCVMLQKNSSYKIQNCY